MIGTCTIASDGAVATAPVSGSPYEITIEDAIGGTFDINNYDVTYVSAP